MNIHEHQAKEILKKYGAVVPEGIYALNVNELIEKVKNLKTKKYVLIAQIHAGARGKAGGVIIDDNIDLIVCKTSNASLFLDNASLLFKRYVT